MIPEINVSKTLTKFISGECKCKYDGGKCNSNQMWNNDKFRCECKDLEEHHMCKIFAILLRVLAKMANI